MAKNDASKVQNQLDYRGDQSQNQLNNVRDNLLPQNQSLQNRYNVSADQSNKDYGNIMGNYNSFLSSPGASYTPSNQNFGAYSGYQDFANTGGFTPQNVQDIRARSVAPMRATYANAMADVDRRNVLAGGNLANAPAAKSQMARNLGYGLADASTNTEAMLAEAIRSGKLAGLGGMTGIDTSRMQEGLANAGRTTDTQLANRSQGLQAISGMGNLYGTTPGATNMYGNQLGQSNSQMNQLAELQNQISQMLINAQLGKSSVPSNYQQALGNIGGTLGLAGQVGGVLGGLGGITGSGGLNGLPGGTKGPF